MPLKLFPQKLWDLVNDSTYSFCLRWSEDGQLVYLNRDELEHSYLKTKQNQFHTQKAISFVRQMNMYGFRKVDDCYYENDNFKRNRHHLLKNMIRKRPNTTCQLNKVPATSASPSPLATLHLQQQTNQLQQTRHQPRHQQQQPLTSQATSQAINDENIALINSLLNLSQTDLLLTYMILSQGFVDNTQLTNSMS